jgi:hypothetical protein
MNLDLHDPVMPRIFVSATTSELGTYRLAARDVLARMNVEPIVQEQFSTDYRSIIELLREQIGRADAVLCLVGFEFGAEPRDRPHSAPRRSYTQLEYDVARELGKPIYRMLARGGGARDVPVEDDERRRLQLEHRTARFLATQDVETLALQESFALGQAAALRVYPAARGVGSSRDLLGAVAWLGYTLPWQDGFLRAVANSSIEAANDAQHQASAQGALRVVTPRLGFARLVVDSAVVSIYENYLNRRLALGGDTRPRGYRSASMRGPSAFAATAELRTTSVNVLSARVGLAAFYDVGGVDESLAEIRVKQSLGAGVRILFPQLNRQVFRLDWAAPLSAPDGFRSAQPLPGAVYFTFGQAFDNPKVKLPEILGSETTLLEVAQ